MNKPSAPSAERNKEPIVSVMRRELQAKDVVLEIGSGTGQHACYVGSAMPDIVWQPTELRENISAIESWLDEYKLSNVQVPVVLDVNHHPWPVPQASADVCFTCNTFHIVSETSVVSVFKGCESVLGKSGKLMVYGPFTIDGEHVSPSNEEFDQWLHDSDPNSGVRDLTELDNIAHTFGFAPSRRIEMPANNFMVVWEIA